MINNLQPLKNLEIFGERYCHEYLIEWNKELLEQNWWEALKMFLKHTFMRGRRDELSLMYYEFTINVLQEMFYIFDENREKSFHNMESSKHYFEKSELFNLKKDSKLRGKDLFENRYVKEKIIESNPFVRELLTQREVKINFNGREVKKKICLENDLDVFMVMDVLNFVASGKDKKNIYIYLINSIKNNGVKFVYDLLCSHDFYGIGDKIASFIIRDILLLNPEIKINDLSDYIWAFPVDTWVAKAAERFGFIEPEAKFNSKIVEKIRKSFIEPCKATDANLNPLKIAAGAWYVGFRSEDLIYHILARADLSSLKDFA